MDYRALQKSTDEELMTQLRSGHHDALAVILDRYQRLVWSVAKRIVHDSGEAEDVVQIVFLDLFRKVELFDPERGTLKVPLFNWPTRRPSIVGITCNAGGFTTRPRSRKTWLSLVYPRAHLILG